ncbi:putative general secretion pathway protein I, GspI [Sinorhizobium fredii NGR234]|uniref:General secretion pathway protein I, GspI n=2 Tax=Rhizobium fredii TaxID=380 RepID=C3MFK2_SINFN|nr:type II secretion system protein [Sinorhizobium fredii]ACP26059.1 putative general secretion pathway protein I, GspI [Sinorhizobium fredii NGR234]
MTPRIDRDEGFTLLEMLIAFLILSTALVVANQSVSTAVRVFSTTREIGMADRLVSAILIEHLDKRGTIIGEEAGRTPEGYAWRISRTLLSGGAIDGQVVRASLSVVNPQGKLIRTYVTYFAVAKREESDVDH